MTRVTAFLFGLAIAIQAHYNPPTIKKADRNNHVFYKRDTSVRISSKKALKEVFVINEDGISGYSSPAGKNDSVHLNYGDKLFVIGMSGNWYQVTHYADTVYVRKSATIIETEISLTDSDLNVAYYNDSVGQPEKFPNIEIKLISKALFDQMKAASINYFEADTQRVKKIKGKFSLRFGKRLKTFSDNKENDYEYIGQFRSLNAYVVNEGSEEAEHSYFVLLDKSTGKAKYGFPAMPFFSGDKKFSICVDPLDTDMADVYVYRNEKKGNSDYAFGRYKNWLPADTYEQFWGIDGCFYLPVLPKIAYRDRGNNPMHYPVLYNCRYIRIKVTWPSPKL